MPLSEFDLIKQLFAPLATSAAALGLTDDVALLRPRRGHDLVVTTDAVLEGIDFFATDPPATIARKALRVNLSDLAAKGADPFGYLLTLALPKRIDIKWLKAFTYGLAADQKEFGIVLLGGDLSSTPGPLTISITAFGYVPKGKAILRRGAKLEDLVFVSGTIGDSGAGLEALQTRRRAPASIARYRVPQPRTTLGPCLRGIASAALDISDGLLADLGHLADVSKVHIVIDAAKIPLSPAARKLWGADAVPRAATAGDDYEIAFTAPRARRGQVFAAAKKAGVAVTEIGWVMQGRGVALMGPHGRPIPFGSGGWRHPFG